MESWCILLHLAATLDWDTQQINIKTAFLYRLLPVSIYGTTPQVQRAWQRGLGVGHSAWTLQNEAKWMHLEHNHE